jgi:IclR family mhp operon transcriptional activator
MHRNVRALSRGLALIGDLNASGPSSVVQLAKRTGLNRTTCYRLLDTLRDDGYVTFDETNAVFGLTPQVRTLSEGVSSRDLSSQAALPAMFSLLDQVSWPSDFGVFELGSVLIRESTHPFSPLSVHRPWWAAGGLWCEARSERPSWLPRRRHCAARCLI